jgi:hypothetical protein
MANYNLGNMTDICKKGAAASKAKQKARAKATWEALDLRCQACGKKFEWDENVAGHHQRRRKFCNNSCTANFRWRRYREATGKEAPAKPWPILSVMPFGVKGSGRRGTGLTIHAKSVYFSRFDAATCGCELCGESRMKPDVAHVTPVADFPAETPLLIINQLSNLIGLCPNCHRLFDTKLIHRVFIDEVIARRPPRPVFQLTEAEQAQWDRWARGETKLDREPVRKMKRATTRES